MINRVRRLAGTAPAAVTTYLAQTLPAQFVLKTTRGSADRHEWCSSCVGNLRSGRFSIDRCPRSRPGSDFPADQLSQGWSSGNQGFAPTPTPFISMCGEVDIEIGADAGGTGQIVVSATQEEGVRT